MDTKILDDFMKKAQELGLNATQTIDLIKSAIDEFKSAKDCCDAPADMKALNAAKSLVKHEKDELKDMHEEKAAAYVEGFVKRATENGLSIEEGVGLLKSALNPSELLPHILEQIKANPELANALGMGAAGAAVGGLGGAALGDQEHKGRNFGLGALAGGLGGAGAGYGVGSMERDTDLRKLLLDRLQQAQTGQGMPEGTGVFPGGSGMLKKL